MDVGEAGGGTVGQPDVDVVNRFAVDQPEETIDCPAAGN
jgi:hypothetical protein